MIDTEERPILSGVIALVGVALVIGLLGGLAVMFGAKTLGLGGDDDTSSASSDSSNVLVIPDELTDGETPEGEEPVETAPVDPGVTEPATTETPADEISLSASQTSVAPMQQIDLTGTYPTGEGAILQVQRFEDGAWQDFPVTMPVSGQTFSTYVQTSRPGPNKFRVVDTDSQKFSNEIEVTVG